MTKIFLKKFKNMRKWLKLCKILIKYLKWLKKVIEIRKK